MILRVIFLSLLLPFCLPAAEPPALSLLSDNIAPGGSSKLYPEGTPVIKTGADHAFVTTGEFATDEETLSSSQPEGVKRLFDGGDWWKSQTFSKWGKGKWVTVTVDLRRDYLIGQIDVWALRDTNRDTAKAIILFSADGETYTQHGIAENTTAEAVAEKDGQKNFVLHRKQLELPVRARFVQLRMERRRHQQQLADIAIWGWAIDGESTRTFLDAGELPPAKFAMRSIQDGAAFMDWSESARTLEGVSKWQVYTAAAPFTRVDAEGVKLAHSFDARRTQGPLYPYTPGETLHFALTAVFGDSVNPVVVSQPFRFPTPFERQTVGDMLAVNHFPGGGAQVRSEQWLKFSLDLLQETPLQGSRWWYIFPLETEMFLERGMGMLTFSLRGEGIKDNFRTANSFGLYSFSKGNEPELKGTPPAQYAASLKEDYAYAKGLSTLNTISAPTCNVNPTALEWLEGFYAAGAAPDFDVLDLHTYVDKPEDLYGKMEQVRAIMATYGDADKPIISTEYGYADRPDGRFRISPLQKAQYLARGLMIHYVLGFRRVYIYSFADIGTDPYDNEHHFGLLDYDLQKKPAYHAVMTLGDQLGDTVLHGPLDGCEAPSLGYQFASTDGAAYVVAVWNAEQERIGQFATAADAVQVTDMLGQTRRIVMDATGGIAVPYGESPVYIRSSQPIRMIGSRENTAGAAVSGAAELLLEAASDSVIVAPDATTAQVALRFTNTHPAPLAGTITVKDAAGATMATRAVEVAVGESTLDLPFDLGMPADRVMQIYTLLLSYKTAVSTYTDERSIAVRRLLPPAEGRTLTTRRFQGLDYPIYILANRHIEASIDPRQGGRVLELIDRQSRTNQVHLAYAKIGDLSTSNPAYAIGFSFSKRDRDTPWDAREEDGSLVLSAVVEETGAKLAMRWTLDDAAPTLHLELSAQNPTAQRLSLKSAVHPEYHVSGYGESTDRLIFPTAEGEYVLPFWIDLGERTLPPLTANHWRATDTVSGLTLRQTFSAGWTPSLRFGHGCYTVEMTHSGDIAPNESQTLWLEWQLETSAP